MTSEIERRLEALDAQRRAEEAALPLVSKAEAYRQGRYRFRAPPVCTVAWREEDWIRFVDSGSGWIGPVTP